MVINKPYSQREIRSLSEKLKEGVYDCDNGSLILASILLNLNYLPEDILTVEYDDPPHLFLLLKPKKRKV